MLIVSFCRVELPRPGPLMQDRASITIGLAYVVLVAGLFIIVIISPTTIRTTPTQVR